MCDTPEIFMVCSLLRTRNLLVEFWLVCMREFGHVRGRLPLSLATVCLTNTRGFDGLEIVDNQHPSS